MSVLKKRFIFCLVGTILFTVVAVLFAFNTIWHAVVLFSIATIILLIITVSLSESYKSARLILENPILNIGMASVSRTDDGAAENRVNVVVSGFGILMDGKPYKFGHGGVNLIAAIIDRESITLYFGDEENAYSVRLLHGIADKAEIDKLSERLRYETGVVADINGW